MSEVVDIHKKKGVRPDYDIYIGRAIYRGTKFIEDSKWCNPFQTSKIPLDMNLEFFEIYARRILWDDLEELDGKILGDWCITTKEITPLKCHGQVLMKLLREKKEKKL